MLSRINGATQFLAQTRLQSMAWTSFIGSAAKALLATAHRTLLVLGVAAITALCMMYFKPDLADRLKALSPFADAAKSQAAVTTTAITAAVATSPAPTTVTPAAPVAIPQVAGKALPATPQPIGANFAAAMNQGKLMEGSVNSIDTPQQQQWVSGWLSRRYHVANDAANLLVNASYNASKETNLDPLLILAVMCIESGLNPFAESPMGAQGLMQVMWKVHHARFDQMGGIKAALNPAANIRVGAMILRDFVNRGGSVEAGLKSYVGAAAFANDAGYGSRVMAEYHRLQEVATGKPVPTAFTPVLTTAMKQPRTLEAIPSITNGKPEVPAEQPAAPDSASVKSHVEVDATSYATL